MRQTMAPIVISTVIFAVSSSSTTNSAFGQGFLKRLQDRVQSLDKQDATAEDPSAATPDVNEQRPNTRRPLVDALLQYGPELFGNPNGSNPGTVGPDVGRSQAVLADPVAKPIVSSGKASLGIDVLDSPPGVPGVLVTGFRSDSRADDAGLQKNDVIVSLDQTLTPKIADIAGFLSQRQPGQAVNARVLRGDRMKTIRIPLLGPRQANGTVGNLDANKVPVAPLPNPPVPGRGGTAATRPASGLAGTSAISGAPETLPLSTNRAGAPIPMNQQTARHGSDTIAGQYGMLVAVVSRLRGAVVEGVVNGSAADIAGIKPADRVVSVDGVLTSDGTAFSRQLQNLPKQSIASLGVVRGNAYLIKGMKLTTEIKPSFVSPDGKQAGVSDTNPAGGEQPMESEKGVLEGIGSVLGGLLGGTERKPSAVQPGVAPQERKAGPNSASDTKPVRQTSFEQKVSGKLKEMLGDPPSLNGLPVKPKSEPASVPIDAAEAEKTGQTPAEMREQIRQLQEKLKNMEERSQAAEDAAHEDTAQEDTSASAKSK